MIRIMKLGTTYICVENMKKSMNFYELLLQSKPIYTNDDRWVTFDCVNSISLYNKAFDEKLLEKAGEECFNQAYIDDFYKEDSGKKNNIIILNFEVENLKLEHERLKFLHIGEVSQMMYVNVHLPYWYFNIKDPDGNILEIAEIDC